MIERTVESKTLVAVCLILSAMLLCSCSMLGGAIGEKIRRPQVNFANARLTGLSFSSADLLFDLKITNPNPLGLKLAGFDYDFLIDDTSFLKGKQEKQLEIAAKGESIIQLPLSLGYIELYQTFRNLLDQDNSRYQINCVFSFDVPVLGAVSVPVSKAGDLPLLKIPTVNLDALRLKSLALSGAELQLGIKLKNPNAFSMLLEHLQYDLEINNRKWVSGNVRRDIQVTEKGESLIEIPIYLDFLEIGRSAYQLLTGDRDLSYQFGGKLDLVTSLPLLGQVDLPFGHSGQIKVIR